MYHPAAYVGVIHHAMPAAPHHHSIASSATLSSGRICLRRWRDEDREAFAAMNSDARVMEFFRSHLSRVQSDAMVDGIQRNFSEHDFGLWAIEVPGVAP